MDTQVISIDLPSDILLALNESENELIKQIKVLLAVRLFNANKLTIGKAAQVAGVTRLEFESYLSQNNIPISHLTYEDVMNDLEKLL